MTGPDPYAVLGIARSASDDEVRAAYRARSLLLHPDLHHERPEHLRREADRAMAQLTEAYRAVLDEHGRGDPGSAWRAAGPAPSAARRAGRLAARARLARLASEAGEQQGGFAYRLGWLVGRRRPG